MCVREIDGQKSIIIIITIVTVSSRSSNNNSRSMSRSRSFSREPKSVHVMKHSPLTRHQTPTSRLTIFSPELMLALSFAISANQPLVSTTSSLLSEIPLSLLGYDISPLFHNPVYAPKSTSFPLTMPFIIIVVTLNYIVFCLFDCCFYSLFTCTYSLSGSSTAMLLIKLYCTGTVLYSHRYYIFMLIAVNMNILTNIHRVYYIDVHYQHYSNSSSSKFRNI